MNRLIQKLLLFGIVFGLLSITGLNRADAQSVLDGPNWQTIEEEVDWLSDSGNETRGIAVNPETGHVLVATRADGDQIVVLDSEDGSEVGELDLTGVEGGMFAINRIDVSDDGQIFVGNFSLNGPEYRIYRWEDEEAEPAMVFDGNPIGDRVGDGFGVIGTGDDVRVYASGTFSDQLAEFTWNADEGELDEPEVITMPYEDNANASVIDAPGEDAIWINGRDAPIVKMDRDGNVLAEIGDDVIAEGNGELELIENGDEQFLVTGIRAPEDNVFSVIDISDLNAPLVVAVTEDLTVNPNDFRVADVGFDPATSTLTFLVTNSGLFNFTFDADDILTDELLGSYHIPQGDEPRGFESLQEAFDTLNAVGTNGPVTFYITDDLDESYNELALVDADVTENSPLLITPAPGASPTITVADTVGVEGGGAGITLFNTGYVTIDGSGNNDVNNNDNNNNGNNDNANNRNLTILEQDGVTERMISVLGGSPEVTIENVIFESATGDVHTGIRSRRNDADSAVPTDLLVRNNLFGSPDYPFAEGVQLLGSADNLNHGLVYHNEIYASARAITTFYNIDNEYVGNHIELHNVAEDRAYNTGIYMVLMDGETVVRENNIARLAVNASDTTAYAGSIVTNFNSGTITVANNLFGGELVNEGDLQDNNFYGIVINNAGSVADMNVYHNTFRFTGNPDVNISAAVGFDAGIEASGESYDFRNNIVHNEIENDRALAIEWLAGAGQFSSNYNNLVVADEDAHVAQLGEERFETLADWAMETGNDQRSASVVVEFEDIDNWRLAGESVGDVNLAGTPIEDVTTDFDGNPRDEANPYMGAFEGDIILVPEPDIRAFALLEPEDGTGINLEDIDGDIEISWEFPQSTIAWSRYNGELLDDQFAHIGDGESGDGRYIGTENDVDAWLQTPLLENPDTLSFWASTFSNATVLDMVIEISDDGHEWEELKTLEAEDGGTGDINVDWSFHQIAIEREGEYYVRFSQEGDVEGSFYLDDVMVNSYTFTGEVVVDEDFEAWDSFRSMDFTWHLDIAGGDFDDPELSLPADRGGEANSLTLTAGQVDGALEDLGVDGGETFSGSWTVTAELADWTERAEEPFALDITRMVPTDSEVDRAYDFALNQNYPNPFNPTTNIEFTIPETMDVRLDVYSVTGERVATLVNEQREAGVHTVEFDATRLASGIYLYRVTAGEFVKTRQMTLIK